MHKRALGAVAISGVAALALSACGGSTPTPTTQGSAAPAASGTSSTTTSETSSAAPAPASSTTGAPVRDANVDLVIWTDADRAPTVKKIADAFGQENGVSVSVQVAVDTRQQFKDATKVGKGPDIVVGAHDWLGELVQENTVAPISLSADTAAKFPQLAGKTFTYGWYDPTDASTFTYYTGNDARVKFVEDLGLELAPSVVSLTGSAATKSGPFAGGITHRPSGFRWSEASLAMNLQ